MYKMSKVVYKLENGETVATLKEAQDSKLMFTKEYKTVYEEFPFESARTKVLRKVY